ncbi:hypothetical protein [Aquisphaera giovannonii]|uniref:hypothetical protein n=1 Tax=Aquisphaera giovannonii TaxID=406548 RepID=UPI001AEFC372|nr:hypothetical protein [Aquisphaera giovannonii]
MSTGFGLCFRQLDSRLPLRVRTMWKIARFPDIVHRELKRLGFPEDIQRHSNGGRGSEGQPSG